MRSIPGALRAVLPPALALLCATAAPADGGFGARPDAHAPLGVMGDHVHRAGEWMLSYRWSRMRMDGNRSGTRHASIPSIIGTPGDPGRFVVAPTDMDMEMHVLGLMVAPHDRLTLMGMLPYVRKTMDHLRRDGARFTTRSEGIGDFRAAALIELFAREHHRVHLNAGLSFPTGSVDERDDLPPPLFRQRLPYPMQNGSGTWDLLPGLTYFGHGEALSWGLQGIATLRTGRNGRGYRLGDRFDATAWLAHPWTPWLSTSARVAWSGWGNVVGEDDALDPTLVPTADPSRRGGHRLELWGGVNLHVPLGPLGRHRFAVEGGFPAYEWLDGPQLETDWRIVVGWQLAFRGLRVAR